MKPKKLDDPSVISKQKLKSLPIPNPHLELARFVRSQAVCMKRLMVLAVWASVALLMMSFAAGKAMAQAGDVVVHTATVDITHFTGTEPVDQIDMTATFTNNELAELKHCENNTDSLIFHGVKVTVQPGLCGATTRKSNMTVPFFRPLSPTLATFEGLTNEGATADGILHTLTKLPNTCGSYSLRVDAVNVNLVAVRRNPVAVTITFPDGSSGCLAINNALIDQ